jgi:hypothetical protein
MNTAPQDDYSGDLARDLGGWSDDGLLKELSRRTTITTDADHELVSTGAGLHLQHRVPNFAITYDADAETFAVSVPTLYLNLPFVRDGINKWPHYMVGANPLIFKKHTSDYYIYIVVNLGLNSLSTLWWVPTIDVADACDDAETLDGLSPNLRGCMQNYQVCEIKLKTDGTSSHDWIWQKPDIWVPNLYRPGNPPFLYYDKTSRELRLANVQGRGGTNEVNTQANYACVIPVSTVDETIVLGYAEHSTSPNGVSLWRLSDPDITDLRDHYAVIAKITTDADGRAKITDYSASMQAPIAWALTDDIDVSTPSGTKTLHFVNGILTSTS